MLKVWHKKKKKKKSSRFVTHSCFCTPTGVFVFVGVALGWNRSLLVLGPTTNGTWQIWRSNRTANSASQPWPLLLWILNKPLRVQTTEQLGFWASPSQLNLLSIRNKVGGELGNPLSFIHFSFYLTQVAQFFWPFLSWIETELTILTRMAFSIYAFVPQDPLFSKDHVGWNKSPFLKSLFFFIILHIEVENYNDVQTIARVQQSVRKLCPNEYEESITHSVNLVLHSEVNQDVMFGQNPP